MTAPLDGNNLTEFAELNNLEQQVAFVLIQLQARENIYNQANPDTPQNRVTVSPNYDSNQLGLQAVLPLAPSAVTGTIVEGVTTYL